MGFLEKIRPKKDKESEEKIKNTEEKIQPKRRRSEAITIRMTPEEHENFERKFLDSGAKNKTDFVISAVENVNIINAGDKISELLIELRRQGNNLNQIAKKANETGFVESENLENAIQKNIKTQNELAGLIKKIKRK